MNEEEFKDTIITTDDLNVLRVLLHTIRGISPVSTTPKYIASEETRDK